MASEEGAVKLGDLVRVVDDSRRDRRTLGIVVNVDYAGESVPWFGVLVEDGDIHWFRPRGLRKIQ